VKTRYKIIIVAVCAYLGVFFGPVIASNVYCDFISQEMCTNRIVGVNLPPFDMILPTADCWIKNDGVRGPCHAEPVSFMWPFPMRLDVYPGSGCHEMCAEQQSAQHGPSNFEIVIPPESPNPENKTFLMPREATVVLGTNNTVYWRNLDSVPRTIHGNGASWSTETMMPGETAHVTFNRTGSYGYHSGPGSWIAGTIIVLDEP